MKRTRREPAEPFKTRSTNTASSTFTSTPKAACGSRKARPRRSWSKKAGAPFWSRVRNEAGVTAQLKAESPNALPVYATSRGNPRPPQQVTQRDVTDRWLDLAVFNKPPLKPTLSGLELEYRVIQLY